MLVRYKKSFKKIAMGLLSFMPREKQLKTLTETIDCYESRSDRQLFLWKLGEDVVGVIGLALDNEKVEILHIAVNPSFRDEGIGRQMIAAVTALYADRDIVPNESVTRFFEKWTEENR